MRVLPNFFGYRVEVALPEASFAALVECINEQQCRTRHKRTGNIQCAEQRIRSALPSNLLAQLNQRRPTVEELLAQDENCRLAALPRLNDAVCEQVALAGAGFPYDEGELRIGIAVIPK